MPGIRWQRCIYRSTRSRRAYQNNSRLLTINTVFSLVGFVDRVVLIFSLGLEPSSSTFFFFFDFFLFYLCDEESCRHFSLMILK